MEYKDLESFVISLEEKGELIRINDFVSPLLMITEIADRFSKMKGGGKALLFENTGTDFPLLINAFGSEKRIAMALGHNSLDDIESRIDKLFSGLMQPRDSVWDKLKLLPRIKELSQLMPRKLNRKGKCQEIIISNPDLNMLPVLQCWPEDGGRFITLPCVHTIDPETGITNMGMYRMQVLGDNTTGMHWHRHKTGASHFEKYKALGQKMPVSIALGGNPVYTYAATAPMPENIDEYLLAGFLKKSPVKLVKCITNDLYVPGDADFIIEGYIDPVGDFVQEGPFGDHTGFYSLTDYYPVFHIECITHKRNAIYPATVVGVPPMEDAYIGKATERIFLRPLRMSILPELKDMDLPFAGVAHNLAVVKIAKTYPGQAEKVMHSLWGAGQMMFNKILIIVDEDINIHNYREIANAFVENFDPEYSLLFSKGPLDVLDHSSNNFAFGSKLCIDLTRPLRNKYLKKEAGNYDASDFKNNITSVINEIVGIRDMKDEENIPILLMNINKGSDYILQNLKRDISGIPGIGYFDLVILYDEGTALNDLNILVWLLGANLDPARDISFVEVGNDMILLIDATFKTVQYDNFKRDWPNVVVMDDKTISDVDNKWSDMNIGEFIPSPSLNYKSLLKGAGAIRGDY